MLTLMTRSWSVRFAVVCGGLAYFSGGLASASAYDHEGLAREALEHHIRPGYTAFQTSAQGLAGAVTELCKTPSAAGLVRARSAFKDAVLSWGRVEHLRFGPVTDDKRNERLLFWPDPKGVARRQVAAIIETGEESALDHRLAGKSIAVQGFTALDIVLFGGGSKDLDASPAQGSSRCKYAMALSANIASIAKAALDGWAAGSAYEKLWLQPGESNSTYITSKETTQALLQSYVLGIELLRDQRLKGPLGIQKVGAKALEPMLPNSGLAVPFLRANIEGVRSLLREGGFVARQAAPPITDPSRQEMTVLGSIAEELKRAAEAAGSAERISPTPFKDSAAREKLISMGFPLKNAYTTGGRTIAGEAGITLGFSSLDGD